MTKKFFLPIFLLLFLLFTNTTFAKVTIAPKEAGIDTIQTFSVGVPSEKEIPTTSIKLTIPAGVKDVIPNTMSGWEVISKKEGEGKDAQVSEIEWRNGSIPAGQREDFLFSAQVPPVETTVKWEVLQTYSDGSTMKWDQEPYVTTKIVDNLLSQKSSVVPAPSNNMALVISCAALGVSVVAYRIATQKNKKENTEVKKKKK